MTIRHIVLVSVIGVIVLLPGSRFVGGAEGESGFGNATIFEDCPEMEESIVEAEEAHRNGDAEKCIRKYQEAVQIALDKNPRAMYRIGGDEYIKMEYMLSGIEYCHRALMKLDDRSLAIYRRLFESTAAREMKKLAARRDYSGLMSLFRKYPFTESGLAAGELAANVALENGDYGAAATLYNRIIEVRANWPLTIKAAPGAFAVVLAKAALASAKLEKIDYLKHYRAILDRHLELSKAKISVEKREKSLGDYLDGLITACKLPIARPIDDRPAFGGNVACNALMDGSEGRIGGLKWKYEVPADVTFYRNRTGMREPKKRPYLVSTVPAVSDGKVFVAVGTCLYALDGYNGQRMYASPSIRRLNQSPAHLPPPNTFCTVHDGVAYFISAFQTMSGRGYFLEGMVHAIDVNSGEELWNSRKDTNLILKSTYDKLNNEFRFSGPIVPYKDGVLFVAQSIEGFHPNFYLICADAKTGKEKWRKFIATRRGTGSAYSEPVMIDYIALNNDIAYVVMSSGTFVAIDLISLEEKWITRYNQEYFFGRTRRMTLDAENPNPRYWRVNHPIIYKGNMIVAPKDSNYIFCVDGKTGKLLWSVHMPELRYIAGLDDGKLFCLAKHRNYERLVIIDVNTSKIVDVFPEKGGLSVPVGRPALTKSAIYISTAEGLTKFDRKTKTFAEIFDWERDEMYPSNVVAVKSGLYLINTMEIVAFNDPLIEENLSEAIKKNPDDMALRYKRARALFDAGKLVDAADEYKTVFEKVDREATLNGSSLFERVGGELNTCCLRLIDESLARGDIKEALKYAELGFEAAIDPTLKVRTAFALATIHDFAKNGVESVRMYRKVISDIPGTMYDIGSGIQHSSHYYATARIGELITKYGRQCYANFDEEAAKAGEAVLAGADEQAHIAFYEKYPNSLAANKVMAHLAEIYEKSGRASMALVVYKNMAGRKIPDAENVDALLGLQRLSSGFEEYAPAMNALLRLSKLPPETVADIDGTQKSVVAFAAERLADIHAREAGMTDQTDSLGASPQERFSIDLGLALNDKNNDSYFVRHAVPRMITPKGRKPDIMSGRMLTVNMSVLRCWDAATGKMLWVNSTPNVWLGFYYSKSLHIGQIVQGSPAQKAGITPRQRILKINGQETKNIDDLVRALDKVQPGEKVILTCGNGKKSQDYEVIAEITPPDLTKYYCYGFYASGSRFITQSQSRLETEIKCIDLKTGTTLWRHVENNTFAWAQGLPFGSNLAAIAHFERDNNNFILLDMSSGKVVAKHEPIRFFNRPINVAGDCYVTVNSVQTNSRAMECRITDILTGKTRCKIDLGQNARYFCEIAGERLLMLQDGKRTSRIFDLYNCTEIENRPNYADANTVVSGKYAIHYNPYRSRVYVYGVLEGKNVSTCNAPGRIRKAAINGDNLLVITESGKKYRASLYDMKSGRNLWSKDIQGIGRFNHAQMDTRYVVATFVKANEDNSASSSFVVSVLDVKNGALVTRVRQTSQGGKQSEIAAKVVNGRLVILSGDTMRIFK